MQTPKINFPAAAEMAFAGGLGAWIGLDGVPSPLWTEDNETTFDAALLFSESNTRFLCEIEPGRAGEFEAMLRDLPFGRIGEVRDDGRLKICGNSSSSPLIDVDVMVAKEAWQGTLRF